MLRILRWLNDSLRKQPWGALALSLGMAGGELLAADMSTPAQPYPLGRPRAASQFSGSQNYGQAAYSQYYAPPARRAPSTFGTQQYNQQQYGQQNFAPYQNQPGQLATATGAPMNVANSSATSFPLYPFIPQTASPQAARGATASPYSFAGTPLVDARVAPPSTAPRTSESQASQSSLFASLARASQTAQPSPEIARLGAMTAAMTVAKPSANRPASYSAPTTNLPTETSASQLRRLHAASTSIPEPTKPTASPSAMASTPRPMHVPVPTSIPMATSTSRPMTSPMNGYPGAHRPAGYMQQPYGMPGTPMPAAYFAQSYSPYAQFAAGQFPPMTSGGRGPIASRNSLAAFNNDLVQMEQLDPLPADEDKDEPSTAENDSGSGPPQGNIGATPADQVFGIAPPSNELQFLRAQSVLLEPGERQLDVGVEYAISEGRPLVSFDAIPTSPPPFDTDEANIRARQRLFLIPLELRYGVKENVQAFIAAPIGWASAELAAPGFDEYQNKVGIGDTNFGASILLCDGGGNASDVIATIAVTAPTGDSEFPLIPTTPYSALGEGFWAGAASILCINNYDPVVVFYGLGYRHRFDATFNDIFDVDPGEQIIYQFGVGFAANETVTLSANFVGMYITENYVNDIRIQGGMLEPMQLRFAITCSQECKIIEPFCVVGMTEDAPSARFGITWTY